MMYGFSRVFSPVYFRWTQLKKNNSHLVPGIAQRNSNSFFHKLRHYFYRESSTVPHVYTQVIQPEVYLCGVNLWRRQTI